MVRPVRRLEVAGIDGCRAGWVMVLATGDDRSDISWHLFNHIADALDYLEETTMIGVDMPIGLADVAERGGRLCDRAARKLLGQRSRSVFSPPVRSALVHCDDYDAACDVNAASSGLGIRLSCQTFNIMPKMRELDQAITPERQKRVKEVHPELAFWRMAGGRATEYGKKIKAGRDERLNLLTRQGFGDIAESFSEFPRSAVQIDDLLDAAAVCWVARRIAAGEAKRVPETLACDAKGLAMEIWF